MVGEELSVTAVVTATDPLCQAHLSVKAEYLEGGGHSDLQIFTRQGADRQPLQVHSTLLPIRQSLIQVLLERQCSVIGC